MQFRGCSRTHVRLGACGVSVFLVQLGLIPLAAQAVCFDDGIAFSQRSYLRDSGMDVPIGFWLHDWASAKLASSIAKILIEEKLGFVANMSGVGSSSHTGLYATAGCRYPLEFKSDPGCDPDPHFKHHIAMEVWGTGKVKLMRDKLAATPQIIPEDAGSLGFDGLEGSYVFDQQLEQAFAAEGLPLEYFKSYNVDWHSPSAYFDNYTSLDPGRLRKCADTRLHYTDEILRYLDVVADSDGVESTEEGIVAKCWFESWWLSPACRSTPETCIPFITGGNGWYLDEVMVKAAYFNMPFAIAIASSSADWVGLARDHPSIPYWWQPDASFVDLDPVKIIFPPTNEQERSKGLYISSASSTLLSKWIYANMFETAPRVRELMLRFSLPLAAMEAMLKDQKLNPDLGDEAVACKWLKQETEMWSAWIPRTTDCNSGQGLQNANGDFVASRQNATGCAWCLPGMQSKKMSDQDGTTYMCEMCLVGTSQPMPGQAECVQCGVGEYSASNGSLECSRCEIGFYQDRIGSADCKECPHPLTTIFLSARKAADCVCPSGTYQADPEGCRPCPEGMVCAQPNSSETAIPSLGSGSSGPYPMVKSGYMTLTSNPLKPYKCQPSSWCPGGPPASCAPHRDSSAVACGLCSDGTYTDSDGTCQPCTGGMGALLIVGFLAAGIGFLCVLVFFVNGNILKQRHSTMTCVLVLGLTVTSVQSMGVFNKLSITWFEPLKSIFTIMSLLSFDLGILQLECTFNPNPLGNYTLRQLFLPVSLIVLAAALYLKKVLRPSLNYKVELVNAAGSLFQVLFISVVLLCAVPFVCYSHPADMGYSMLESQSVVCYESSLHKNMMAVGGASFFIVIGPFIALVVYGTAKYHDFARESNANRGEGLQMFRFLFFRFHPSRYYCGSVVMARSLCVCSVPIVFRDNSASQVIVMGGVFLGFGSLQLYLQPWRSWVANVADAGTSSVMVLMLLCAAVAMDAEGSETIVGVLGSILFAILVIGVIAALSLGLYMHLIPTPYFHMFICHHKRDASAQSRFLQLSLQQKTGQKCFLDSDHLTDLNDLLDVVRSRLGRLVVFLTSDTLKRPWCAGEITVTFKTHRRLTIVRTPSFLAPTPAQIQDVGSYLDQEGTNLLELGISADLIAEAYTWLLEGKLPCIEMKPELCGRSRFACVVDQLVGSSARASTAKVALEPGMLVFSSDPADDEATAACGILISKLQADMMGMNSKGFCMLADAEPIKEEELFNVVQHAQAVVIVLTSGSLQCLQQLQVIVTAMAAESPKGIISVNTPNFRFPGDRSFSDVRPTFMPARRHELQDVLQRFFKLITVFLATNASDKVLVAQAKEVLGRVPTAAPMLSPRSSKVEADNTRLASDLLQSVTESNDTKEEADNRLASDILQSELRAI